MATQSPLIAKLTQWMGIRRHRMWLRYSEDLSTRSIPKPAMPPSEHSAISSNYYYSRDARREVAPPTVISQNGAQKRLEGTADASAVAPSSTSFPTPGVGPQWTLSKENGL